MDGIQLALAERYKAILGGLSQHWLDRSLSHERDFAKLSGLFLPGVSQAYLQASKRIMVIGREPRKWQVLTEQSPYLSLDDYIQKAMNTQQTFLKEHLPKPRDAGESFFNLLRALAADHGPAGIAWANLFSFSWNGKSPMRWTHFKDLLDYSERLLKAQIELLEPDIIIFANGASSARFRQRYFPHKGPDSVCSELTDYRALGIPIEQLWSFHLHGKIQCYRIQHPSSISNASRRARAALLALLLHGDTEQTHRLNRPENARGILSE